MYPRDTIVAISTPLGESGIGIVRLSGDQAAEIADTIFCSPVGKKLKDQSAYSIVYGHILCPQTKKTVDEVLVSVMRAPTTYTREDVVEINCHGGISALRETLGQTLAAGARLAEPGEFTKRAFLNGRIDLAQAEAVIDVIKSRTKASLEVALGQLQGGLSDKLREIKNKLLEVAAHLEAAVDFSDEDIEVLPRKKLIVRTKEAYLQVEKLLESAKDGKIFREGVKTAIVGKPNVGKSSLLNALAKEERAIVTSMPGTTRDVIEETISVKGIPLRLQDTAGIRHPKNEVEEIGVGLSKKSARQADLALFIIDVSRPLSEEDRVIAEEIRDKKVLMVLNKSDLSKKTDGGEIEKKLKSMYKKVEISATKGTGINELKKAITSLVFEGKAASSDEVLVTNMRHQDALKRARDNLRETAEVLEKDMPEEIAATVLKEALDALGEITGEITSENVLDRIFSQFCIGK